MPSRGLTEAGGRVSVYDPSLTSTHSTNLWKTCPMLEHRFDPSIGFLYEEPWDHYTAGGTEWTLTQATAGTAAIDTTAPGRLKIDAGSTTQHQGVNLQRLKTVFLPAANKSIWYECKFQLTATTPPVTKAELFVGLAASDTTIFSSGAHSTNNRIGWHIQTAENLALTFGADKAGTNTTATGTTLVDATDIRVGFFYDGAADTLQQYINGVATGTALATTYIPKAAIYPSFVCQTDGTDQPNVYVSALRIFQLR